MDNKAVHVKIHQKISNTLGQIDGQGEIEVLPNYYGKVLFETNQIESDEHITNACKFLSGEEISEDLPIFLKELLKTDKEALLAQLIEYYTRHHYLIQSIK